MRRHDIATARAFFGQGRNTSPRRIGRRFNRRCLCVSTLCALQHGTGARRMNSCDAGQPARYAIARAVACVLTGPSGPAFYNGTTDPARVGSVRSNWASPSLRAVMAPACANQAVGTFHFKPGSLMLRIDSAINRRSSAATRSLAHA